MQVNVFKIIAGNSKHTPLLDFRKKLEKLDQKEINQKEALLAERTRLVLENLEPLMQTHSDLKLKVLEFLTRNKLKSLENRNQVITVLIKKGLISTNRDVFQSIVSAIKKQGGIYKNETLIKLFFTQLEKLWALDDSDIPLFTSLFKDKKIPGKIQILLWELALLLQKNNSTLAPFAFVILNRFIYQPTSPFIIKKNNTPPSDNSFVSLESKNSKKRLIFALVALLSILDSLSHHFKRNQTQYIPVFEINPNHFLDLDHKKHAPALIHPIEKPSRPTSSYLEIPAAIPLPFIKKKYATPLSRKEFVITNEELKLTTHWGHTPGDICFEINQIAINEWKLEKPFRDYRELARFLKIDTTQPVRSFFKHRGKITIYKSDLLNRKTQN